MTGRDVPTRQKISSVAFSAIMILSMVAVGGLALSGSAAALDQADEDGLSNGSGYIVADPANASAQANHTIRIQASQNLGNLNASSARNVTVNYKKDVTFPDANVSGPSGGNPGGDISDGANAVEMYVNDTRINNANVTFNEGANTVEINVTDDATVSQGDIVTIELGVNGNSSTS